jgi:hypothetical protein
MRNAIAVGIECVGSSHSFCVVVDQQGVVLAAERYDLRINAYEQSMPEVAARVHAVLRKTLKAVEPPDDIDDFFHRGGRICVCITGITTANDRVAVKSNILQRLDFPDSQVLTLGDAEVLLSGAAGSLRGAVLIWHAGSVAYARNTAGPPVRVGGWGHLLGDEGSGYYMGRKALHALTWHRDRYREPSPELAASVRKHLFESATEWGDMWRDLCPTDGMSGAMDDDWIDCLIPYTKEIIERGIYRYAISDLVKAVVTAAEKERVSGKPEEKTVATNIVKKSVHHLCDRLKIATEKAGLVDSRFPLVLAGGVVVHNPYLRERLEEGIKRVCASAEILPVAEDGIYHTGAGAALHALSGNSDTLPSSDVCQRVREEARQVLGNQDRRPKI